LAKTLYKTDSLEQALSDKEVYYKNLMNIVTDNIPKDTTMLKR
jgi:hypothetical protein